MAATSAESSVDKEVCHHTASICPVDNKVRYYATNY
jgi:hypothetical protein